MLHPAEIFPKIFFQKFFPNFFPKIFDPRALASKMRFIGKGSFWDLCYIPKKFSKKNFPKFLGALRGLRKSREMLDREKFFPKFFLRNFWDPGLTYKLRGS